jgi:4-hydroxy-tetrahydrodipicolinate synthase
MKEPIFTGACVAIVTPFTETGIDFDKLGDLIEMQIAGGTNAICICGTTGESATQTMEEHLSAIEYCIKKVAGRVKVIAGTGSNCTEDAIYLSKSASEMGADALLVVTPYYNKTSQRGLIQHYTAIADAVTTPIILYNVPSRTGVSFTAETYRTLAQHPNIIGVKEASGNFSLITHTLALCPEDFYIWSGEDGLVVPMMAMGCKGVISVVSNVAPQMMAKLTRLCLDGNFAEAGKLQVRLSELCDAMFCDVNPIPVKNAMNMMGLNVGKLRLPLYDLDEAHAQQVRTALQNVGIELN